MSELRALAEAAREQMVDDLTRYIEVETPSDDKQALARGFAWVREYLQERLGAPAAERIADGGEYGDMAVLDYHGTPGATGSIAILCHYDTVWPMGTLEQWPVTVDGDRLTGPGAFDMKSGLVQAVWAIRFARELSLPLPRIRFVLNGDEEIGSPASRPVIEQAASGFEAALVFEASAEGRIKTERKGVGIFDIVVHGIEGHAGLDPEKGVSAIDEMARIVLQLHGASDLAAGTTVNVGTLQGGSRSNVTAGRAAGRIDVRVSSQDEMARIDDVLGSLAPHNPQASVEVSGEWNRPLMQRSAATGRLFALAQEAAHEIGTEVQEISVGGASDGNFVAAMGIPVLDGLGAVGDGAHARHEWVSIDGIVERSALVAHLMEKLA